MTEQPTTSSQQPTASSDDLLWRQLKTIPAFRALLRAVEARFYQQIDMPGPILDLGCGDGHFTQMSFAEPLDAGIDPWWGPLKKAQKSGMYRHLTQGMGDQMPFPDHHFSTVISNSVLEHIPGIQAVLNDASRVLQPGGQLIITMPSHLFTRWLGGAQFFEKLGLPGMADQYRRFFNFISRHVHTDPPEVWAERLAQAGFTIERWQYYFSPGALHALEWGHVQGLPSAILHALTGHWILAPWEDNLRRTERWVRPFYEESFPTEGAYLFFVARKEADGPIEATLPPAHPYTKLEPELEQKLEQKLEPEPELEDRTSTFSPPPSAFSSPPSVFRLLPSFLLAASLIFAAIGQSILSGGTERPLAGIRWYAAALIPLLLVWRQRRGTGPGLPRFSLPRPREMPRRRWFYLLALFFALIAPRVASNASPNPQPGLAIVLWLTAVAVAIYALKESGAGGWKLAITPSRTTIAITTAFFLIALVLRTVNLSTHPFILNGVEANIGLHVRDVRDGLLSNPFSVTGCLGNPTLLYFLMVWPLRLLGSSALSIRLLSPLVGAATVAATFLIGQRLWGRTVGLIAAIFLLGSHFHLQYSRLGMTNIWDGLLVLLALGGAAIAWETAESAENTEGGKNDRFPQHGRFQWLMVGTAVGSNAYVFSGSHLLPLMLAALAAWALLFKREALIQQWRHIAAAAAVAFIIALPQLSFYNSHPAIFMDRAGILGILDDQTGWLAQESARSGLSQSNILGNRLVQAALSYTYGLDKSGSYRPERPLLSFGLSILFTLGTAVALIRFRQFRSSVLLVWVSIPVIFGGALLLESPSSHRLVIAAPALALLAAIGLVEISQLAVGKRVSRDAGEPWQPPASLLPILLGIAAILALGETIFYFGTYRQQHTFADRNTEIADKVADYLNTLDGETWTAYFYGPPSMYVDFPTIPFLAEEFRSGLNLYDITDPNAGLIPASTPNRTFIFLPERADEAKRVEEMVPNGRLQTFPGFYADPLFYAYEVGETGE